MVFIADMVGWFLEKAQKKDGGAVFFVAVIGVISFAFLRSGRTALPVQSASSSGNSLLFSRT